jgi:hypothetical protein
MTNTLQQDATITEQSVNAVYKNNTDAETAVRLLSANGIPLSTISMIGRSFETVKSVQGYYRPAETKLPRSEHAPWNAGIFGFMSAGLGFFVFPTLGSVTVIGPLAGALSAAIAKNGNDGLNNTFKDLGISPDEAKRYESQVQAGRFLVLVHGFNIEVSLAAEILEATALTDLKINR